MTMQPTNDLLELEIAAFQGPHIKRARIVLAITGALYVAWGLYHYGDVAKARELLAALGDESSAPGFARLQHAVTLAYALVIGAMIAGVANMVLAVLAGTKTMPAFYAAAAVFVAFTGLEMYVSSSNLLMLTDPLWWCLTIALGFGFFAALKAQRMRAERGVPTIPALPAQAA